MVTAANQCPHSASLKAVPQLKGGLPLVGHTLGFVRDLMGLLERARKLSAVRGTELERSVALQALALPRRQELEAHHPEAFVGVEELRRGGADAEEI